MSSQRECSRCGIEFKCQRDEARCWCNDLILNPETLKKLRSEFEDCLCASCLGRYSIGSDAESLRTSQTNLS